MRQTSQRIATNLLRLKATLSYFFLRSSMGMEAIRLGTVGAVQTKLALKNIKSMNVPFAPACAIERTTSTLNGILELI